MPKNDIFKQLIRQLESHFTITEEEIRTISRYFDEALDVCEENFVNTSNKYYYEIISGEKRAKFNPYHSGQYMIFLYTLSHIIFIKDNYTLLCDKLYYLNKIFHSVDILYAVEMPSHFHVEHPLGSVMGRAKYSNGFVFLQGCTVGGTRDKEGNLYYPIIEENVHMFVNSSILGRCHIGRNAQIGAGALVKNQDVPADSIVFGQSPNLILKKR